MKEQFPQVVKACLWSYDTNLIDIKNPDHQRLIIKNVLDRGTIEAVDWLIEKFTKEEIVSAIKQTSISDWNKKSLSLWELVFGAKPARFKRFA